MSAPPAKIENMEENRDEEQVIRPASKHMFQGTHRYRVALLVGALVAAILLAASPLTVGQESNWVHQLCSWFGAFSAIVFACLMATDILRPQTLTVRRMKGVMVALVASAGLAITFMVIGFFI